MFADTGESETVFAPVIQAGIEAFKVSPGGRSRQHQRPLNASAVPVWEDFHFPARSSARRGGEKGSCV